MREPYADEALSALLDGELDDEARTRLESELAGDADLRDELEQLRRVRDFLRAKGPAEAPPDFLSKVLAKVENEPMPANSPMASFLRRPFGVPLEAVAVAAVALFVVLAGVGIGGGAFLTSGSQGSKFAEPEMTVPAAHSDAAAPTEAPAAGAEQNLDPAQQQYGADQREIELQGVQYGDKTFGRGKTAEELGIQGTAGASNSDLGTGTKDKDIPALDAAKKELALPKSSMNTATPTTAAPEPITTSTAPSTSTSMSKPVSAPASSTSAWRYVVTADGADVLGDLLSIAARTGGRVEDASRRAVRSSGGGGDTGTYFVVVPADQVGRLNTALTQLGAQLDGRVDGSMYTSGWVAVEVRIVQFARGSSTAPNAPVRKGSTPTP